MVWSNMCGEAALVGPSPSMTACDRPLRGFHDSWAMRLSSSRRARWDASLEQKEEDAESVQWICTFLLCEGFVNLCLI